MRDCVVYFSSCADGRVLAFAARYAGYYKKEKGVRDSARCGTVNEETHLFTQLGQRFFQDLFRHQLLHHPIQQAREITASPGTRCATCAAGDVSESEGGEVEV